MVFFAIVFYAIYTGGGCNVPHSEEQAAIEECKRLLKGTQGYAFCDCGNKVECR